ncbi:MAG: hypothetical protein ACYDEY_07915 [Acidimicrobiales bacterium]
MRRVLRNSKVSLGLAGVILALFCTLAWFAFFGTTAGTGKINVAALSNATIARAADSLAGGTAANSYRGVTSHSIAAYVARPDLASVNGLTVAKVIMVKGAVTRSSYFVPVKNRKVEESSLVAIVSVDLCADGKACQEIVVASWGVGNKCWYERQTVGNRSIARKEHLRIGYEYQASSVSVCKASNAPRSGWIPGLPNS